MRKYYGFFNFSTKTTVIKKCKISDSPLTKIACIISFTKNYISMVYQKKKITVEKYLLN